MTNPPRQHGLQSRIALAFFIAATSAFLLVGMAILFYQSRLLESRVRSALEPNAELVAVSAGAVLDFPTDEGERYAKQVLEALVNSNPQIVRADILHQRGVPIATYPTNSPPLTAADWQRPDGVYLGETQSDYVRTIFSPGENPGRLVIRMSLEQLQARNRQTLGFVALGGFFVILAISLAHLWAMRRGVVMPLEHLAEAVDRLHENPGQNERVPEVGHREFQLLGKNFNRLLDRVKLREIEARDKNSLLEATLQATADGILVVAADGRITDYNQQLVEMWHISAVILETRDGALLGDFMLRQVENSARPSRHASQLNDTSRSETIDVLYLLDGRIFERSSRPQLVEGQVTGRVWSFRDVTAERRAESALRESEHKFKTLFDTANDAILLMNHKVFLDCNHQAEAMFGIARQGIINESLVRFSPEHQADGTRSAERALEKISEAFNGAPQFFEWIHCRADGSPFNAEVSLNRIELHGQFIVQAIVRDITARKRAEAAQREAEELYRTLVNTSPDGIAVLDLAGTVRFASPQDLKIYGLPNLESKLGRSATDFVVPAGREQAARLFHQAVQGGFLPNQRFEMLRPDGTRFIAELNGALLRDALGVARGVMVITRDVTELQRQEDELKGKNEELERFTYTVSHDLKSPIITIKGFAGALLADVKAGRTDRLGDDLRRIIAASDKMTQLLNGLLELSRVGRISNAPVKISMTQLVEDVVELLSGSITQQRARVTVQRDMPSVLGDPQRLSQVMQNLIENALKFSGNDRPPEIAVGWQVNAEGMTVFFVKDQGMGIDPRHRETIFGLFSKLDARSEGTGIGLALVRRIIQFHGGQIWVAAGEDGVGTVFYFTLPIAAATSEAIV